MAEPKQKSIEIAPHLQRILPAWITPMWIDAGRWRSVVRNQPVAIICRDRLITYAQALPWEIRATDLSEQKALEPDIKYYRDFVFKEFDLLMDLLWQDALDLPIGGNVEVIRWPAGAIPRLEIDGETYELTRPWEQGHVFRLAFMDGATVFPTYDPTIPLMQRITQFQTAPVYFNRNEVRRIVLTPRPEWQMKGYGMPPPQRVFLAISLLYRGDQYYANLLLDTPEAGVLDLMDMTMESASQWLSSFKSLVEGVDPMKIGVLYEHDQAARWIPFGRPPTDMMFESVTGRYARMTTAGYWLTLTDLGLEGGGSTMAGEIRRQREVRLSGFGLVREKTKNFMVSVLPPWLTFHWIEKDDEAMSALGRARLLNAQALKTLRDAGVVSVEEAQAQLAQDGLLTIELKPPEKAPPLPPLPAPAGNELSSPKLAKKEAERVPPSQGGEGDVGVQRALTGADSADRLAASSAERLADLMSLAFQDVTQQGKASQIRKLIKAAARRLFELSAKALTSLPDSDLPLWAAERVNAWFGQPSVLDEFPEVKKADQALFDQLDKILDGDPWWTLPEAIAEAVAAVLAGAYGEGATGAAEEAMRFLYEEGLVSSPELIGFNWELKNPRTLAEINQSAAQMVRRVNDGTKHYLKSLIAAGVDEGLSSQEIAARIKEGQGLEQIMRDSPFLDSVTEVVRGEIGDMLQNRIQSITNTEIAKAETNGRIGQWGRMGLNKKKWSHTGLDTPCMTCTANIELGYVSIDYQYTTVFGPETAGGPPAHPRICHCHLEFDEAELLDKARSLNVWSGE